MNVDLHHLQQELEVAQQRIQELELELSTVSSSGFSNGSTQLQSVGFQSLVESSPDFILLIDRSYCITYINQLTEGSSLDDVVGIDVFDFIAPEYVEIARTAIERVFEGADSARYETYGPTLPLGELKWFETRVYPSNRQAETAQAMLIARDITELKKAEEALQRSESRYRQILEVAQEGIWLADIESRTTYVNQRMADMLGYSPKEMMGKTFFEFMDEAGQQEAAAIVRERDAKGGIAVEFRYKHKDGGDVWAIVSTNPLMNDNGDINGAMALVTDITARKQLEFVREHNEKRLQEAQRIAKIGNWEWDTNTNELYWSEELLRLFGIEPTTRLTFDDFMTVIIDGDKPAIEQIIEETLQNPNKYHRAEFRITLPTGEIRTFELRLTAVLNSSNSPITISATVQDVTEAKMMQDKLRASQQEIERILENSVDIIGTADFNGYFVNINPAAERILGYSIEELKSRPYTDLVHPDDIEATLAEAEKVAEGATVLFFENRYLTKNGNYIWMSWRGTPDLENRVMHITGRDVTSEKQAQEETERILNTSVDIIGIADFDGYFTRLNPAAERILGYRIEELKSRPFIEFVHPDDVEQTNAEAAKVAEGKTALFFENRYLTKNGDYRWMSWTATPDVERGIMQITGRDVTVEKLGEQEISRLASIVESASDFIATASLEGNSLYINPAGRLITGLTLDDDASHSISYFHPDAEGKRIQEDILPTVIETGSWTGETILYGNHRQEIPVSSTIFLNRDEFGQPLSFSTIMRDISQQKLAVKEREKLITDLQAARRIAEENSRLKSEFLATMSHELRTPMNAIEGFTSIMLNHLGGVEYNAAAANFIRRIQSNSKRLLALINDFLDLSRIESGRLELAHMPFSPKQLVASWQAEIGVLAEEKNLHFKTYISPNVSQTLYGDEESISKIAINLLSNAIKFTDQGEVTISIEQFENNWSIKVQDTGVGIPPHARDYIFDEFRQVDQSSRRKHGGTGLGLAIVQRFVRLMGGSITLETELGQGSTFTVILPVLSQEG